jgi:hypothetical protein
VSGADVDAFTLIDADVLVSFGAAGIGDYSDIV